MLLLIIAASTAWRTGLTNSIPIQAHVMLDYVLAIFLIAAPFLLASGTTARRRHSSSCSASSHLLVTIATRFVGDERPVRE